MAKNLKLLTTDGTVKIFTTSAAIVASDYYTSVWLISGGINLTELTPQKGMILILSSLSSDDSTVTLATNCYFNSSTSNNQIIFKYTTSNAILYATSTTNINIISNLDVDIKAVTL